MTSIAEGTLVFLNIRFLSSSALFCRTRVRIQKTDDTSPGITVLKKKMAIVHIILCIVKGHFSEFEFLVNTRISLQ